MKNTLETRLGLFFAIAIVAAVIIIEMVGGMELFKHGLQVQARFGNVQELKPGDPVKMAGKQIGRVDEIKFDDEKVLVVMKVTDSTARIRTDSRASIKFSGLLGQNYVAVDFGTPHGQPVTEGMALQTIDPQDISQLLTKLDGVATDMKKITGNLSDVNLDEIVLPLSDFVKESRPRLMGIVTNFQAVSVLLASGQGTIGRLLNDETLYNSALGTVTNLNETAVDVRAAVQQAKALVADISAGRGTLGRMATDEKLYNEITEASSNLKEVLQKVNRGQGSVGKLVNDDSLINNAKYTLQKLDKATETLEDQGPLTILGILVNPLF